MREFQGINVDVDKLAQGMVDLCRELPSEYQNAMTYGMLPAPIMDRLSQLLKEKAVAVGRDDRWARDVCHAVTCAMLGKIEIVV